LILVLATILYTGYPIKGIRGIMFLVAGAIGLILAASKFVNGKIQEIFTDLKYFLCPCVSFLKQAGDDDLNG
jgi:hypothetical protein